MSGMDRLCSDRDRIGVYSSEECKKAAYDMDYQYMGPIQRSQHGPIKRSQYPKGCYFFHRSNSIFFNPGSTGQKNKNAEQVCKEKGK